MNTLSLIIPGINRTADGNTPRENNKMSKDNKNISAHLQTRAYIIS